MIRQDPTRRRNDPSYGPLSGITSPERGLLFHAQQCLGNPLPVAGLDPPESPFSPIA
jgi:hypothetical protein